MSSQFSVPSFHKKQVGHSFLRWMKFNFVGGIGIGVQIGALALFRSVFEFDYLVATAVAVETAVVHNFLWHQRFTWADRPARRVLRSLARLAKFNVSNGLVSLVGNVLIMRALVGGIKMNYIVANLIAVATCSLVNFLLSDRFVFESTAWPPSEWWGGSLETMRSLPCPNKQQAKKNSKRNHCDAAHSGHGTPAPVISTASGTICQSGSNQPVHGAAESVGDRNTGHRQNKQIVDTLTT